MLWMSDVVGFGSNAVSGPGSLILSQMTVVTIFSLNFFCIVFDRSQAGLVKCLRIACTGFERFPRPV